MTTLASLIGKKVRVRPSLVAHGLSLVLKEQLMGIEVEAERGAASGVRMPRAENIHPWWQEKIDGSLANGREYVLSQPYAGDNLCSAIHNLFDNAVFARAATSSTHIHMDMTEEDVTDKTLQIIFGLVFIFEPVLFAVGDPSRKYCGYTNPITTLPETIVAQIFSSGYKFSSKALQSINSGSRYYGLNMQALSKYGSLEFRYFPTATSKEELTNWVNLVQSFKYAAHNIASVDEFIKLVTSEAGYNKIIDSWFADWATTFRAQVPYHVCREAGSQLADIGEAYEHKGAAETDSYMYQKILIKNKALQKVLKVKKVPTEAELNSNSIWDVGEVLPNGFDEAATKRELYGAGRLMKFNGCVYMVVQDGSSGFKYIPMRSLRTINRARIGDANMRTLAGTSVYALAGNRVEDVVAINTALSALIAARS